MPGLAKAPASRTHPTLHRRADSQNIEQECYPLAWAPLNPGADPKAPTGPDTDLLTAATRPGAWRGAEEAKQAGGLWALTICKLPLPLHTVSVLRQSPGNKDRRVTLRNWNPPRTSPGAGKCFPTSQHLCSPPCQSVWNPIFFPNAYDVTSRTDHKPLLIPEQWGTRGTTSRAVENPCVTFDSPKTSLQLSLSTMSTYEQKKTIIRGLSGANRSNSPHRELSPWTPEWWRE